MSSLHIDELIEFCRIPSVSDDDEACAQAVKFLLSAMRRRGVSANVISHDGNDVIYGELRGSSPKSILYYSHYDVVPVGDQNEWHYTPFETQVVGDRIWGRGVADHKGSVLARIQALDSLIEQGVEPAVTIKFLIEGKEEVGSPGLREAINSLRDELDVEAGFYSGWSRDLEGRPRINGGSRGNLELRVTLHNANHDLHGAYGSLVRDPLVSLAKLLASMVNDAGQVTVPGFKDDAQTPDQQDLETLDAIPFNLDALRARFGDVRLIGNDDRRIEVLKQYYFEPAVSFHSFETSGIPGRGVPSSATALIRVSLVPNQDPSRVTSVISDYLTRNSDLPIDVQQTREPRTPARAPLSGSAITNAIRASRAVFGVDPIVVPYSSGSGPRGLFLEELGLPLISDIGVSSAESNDHSANENIFVEHYLEGIRFYSELISKWS
jgi:acetylornithine deacetylase/succinyl-diaminopimelate desuccinylase-like protein